MKHHSLAIAPFMLLLAACANDPEAPIADAEGSEETATTLAEITEMSAQQAGQLLSSDPSLVVLDVRTPTEFAEGHIEGAMNIDFRSDDFAANLAKLDPAGRYVLHCKSGTRSSAALEVMQEQGFQSVVHMPDGFDGWKEAGQAIAN